MAKEKSSKVLDEKIRNEFLERIAEMLSQDGEEVLRIKSNEIAIPTVDEENNDKWVQIVIKVPTGSRDGDVFDGYSLRDEYEMKLKAKAEKAKADAEKKARKIAKDKAMREQKEKMRKEREGK